MNKKTKVISGKNIHRGLPVTSTIVFYLLLDHLHVSGWVWGVYASLFSIVWILSVAALFFVEHVDIFENK